MADKYLSPQVTYESDKEIHKILREPRGVTVAILPWNYPYMNVCLAMRTSAYCRKYYCL